MAERIQQHTVNIRKRRIMEAFKEEPVDNAINLSILKEFNLCPETINRKLESIIMDEFNIIDKKIKVFESWEITRRKAIEKLVKQTEKAQALADEVDKLEESIMSKGIEINEVEFEMFYQALVDEEPTMEPLDLPSELNPQTPERQEQLNNRAKKFVTSTPITRKKKTTEIIDKFVANEEGMVVIGPNGTTIAKHALQTLNWSLSGAALTRKILMEVFDRETLAFHTLTGKPSPAFMGCDKPMKNQLDPLKVADIIHMVMQHTHLTAKEVRNAITTKCADENKMFRQREKKRINAALKLQKSGELN